MAKIPPPAGLAASDPVFNRWLLELTSILNGSGGIDPGTVAGLAALTLQVAANTAAVASLSNTVGLQGGQITALQSAVNALGVRMTAAETAIAGLQARNQVLNGSGAPTVTDGVDGDWWAATGATKHVYVKLGGAWVQIV